MPRAQSRLKSFIWCHSAPPSKPQVWLQALLAQNSPSELCSNTKGPWCSFLRDHFSSNKIYFPQNGAGYFSLLENDCCVQDESSQPLSDRCQSFICPCSHEVEREPRQWFVSFKRGNICLNLISLRPRGCCWWSSQWSQGKIYLGPSSPNSRQFSSLIYFTQFYMFKSQPMELRGGKAGHRCDRAAGTLNGLKDALEFWGFPLIYHSPPYYICSG